MSLSDGGTSISYAGVSYGYVGWQKGGRVRGQSHDMVQLLTPEGERVDNDDFEFTGTTDDLVGWKERKDGETKTYKGVLDEFGLSKADAEQMILAARLKAGWINEDDLAAEDEDAEAVGA